MSKRNLKARNLRPVRDPELAERMRELEQLRTDDIDGYTVPFEGASDVGVMPGPDTQPFTADNVRDIGYRTWDLRPAPLTGPTPLCAETAEGWAHIFTITCHHCGITGWNDDAPTYDALYRSAWDAGWRQGGKPRYWACRRCAQFNGQYEALWPVALHALTDEELLERTRLHYDASHRRGTHARQATA